MLKIYFKKSIFNGEGVFNSPKVCCDNWLIMFYFSCLNFDFWNLYLYYRLIQSVFCISGIFHKDFSWILLIGPEHRSDVFSKFVIKIQVFPSFEPYLLYSNSNGRMSFQGHWRFSYIWVNSANFLIGGWKKESFFMIRWWNQICGW